LASRIKKLLDELQLVLAALISGITFGSTFDSLVKEFLSDKSVLATMMNAMKLLPWLYWSYLPWQYWCY
jgi:hypothetical protein